ncbi:ArsR/SmtB family transcription factor [Kocuria tytonis]|uniref:ArsR family transcriptional regulator n=1 Tax=Kocuria tytonis TaxID=2054280 RepID=A0A495ADE5_9MICC|nr:metalloregulator ArsR/SmtB family transcription factor [Kocuria tytonis]RKQ36865.1 ArsR family transcriptional regulator [Kocuria tytonis]
MAISPTELPALDARATAAYSHLFQALGEPTRLAVLQHLASGEHRVRDLVAHTGLAQSTVSKHLSFLAQCHLVSARPEGRATWYSLTRPQDLGAVISAAEQLLRATGTHAALCTHLHHPPGPTAADPAGTTPPQESR